MIKQMMIVPQMKTIIWMIKIGDGSEVGDGWEGGDGWEEGDGW